MGYSITLDGESVHLNMISNYNPTADNGVIAGCSGCTQENDESTYAAVGFLKRALIKHSKTKYNSTIDNIPEFVVSFNEKTPEYEQRLGSAVVLEEATKLHEWGKL
jgi:hypothetical protein